MGSGSLSNILLGVGLGILAISGFIVTGLFGQYHNKSKTEEIKYYSKLERPKDSSIRSYYLAIAVLGCLSAVAAIVAIVLSILLEGQTMILIIVGAISALFAFGCIVAEGLYTKKIVDFYEDSYKLQLKENNQDDQKYIKDSIRDLLDIGRKSLMEVYKEEEWDLPTTDNLIKHLGNSIYKTTPQSGKDIIFTYKYLWYPYKQQSYLSNNLYFEDFVVLYKDENMIYATNFNNFKKGIYSKSVHVASLTFQMDETRFTPKQQVCWPDDKNISTFKDFECTFITLPEIPYNMTFAFDGLRYYSEWPAEIVDSLTEKIVVGDYYSPNYAYEHDINVDYEVSNFPIMFHTISTTDLLNYNKLEDKDDSYFVYKDSDHHFGLTGKEYAKYESDMKINELKEGNKGIAIVTLEPVSSYDNLIRICTSYISDYLKDYNKRQDYVCYIGGYMSKAEDFLDRFKSLLESGSFSNLGTDMSTIWSGMNSHYDGYNKGENNPKYDDYRIDRHRILEGIKNYPKSRDFAIVLYTTALIHLIVQIIGIVFWAIGRFIGLATGGGSDAKTQSEGEA